MKRTILLIALLGLYSTAKADPVLIGGGTATIPNIVGAANWDALGLHINFQVANTSTSLSVTTITNNLVGFSQFDNLALLAGESRWFVCELFHVWDYVPADFIAHTTIYFAPATSPVPEPATIGLLAMGLGALYAKRRKTTRVN